MNTSNNYATSNNDILQLNLDPVDMTTAASSGDDNQQLGGSLLPESDTSGYIPAPGAGASSHVTEEYSLPTESNVNRANHDEGSRQVGAGVVTAVVAAPVFGPVLAAVAGVAAAFQTRRPGAAGDACRAAGDVAMIAKDKASEVNQRHRVVDKTSRALVKVQEANVKYQIFHRVKAVLGASLRQLGNAFKFAGGKLNKTKQQKNRRKESEWDYDDL